MKFLAVVEDEAVEWRVLRALSRQESMATECCKIRDIATCQMTMIDQFQFLQNLKASDYSFDVFYDIGANIGVWSREVQKIFPNARFEMFEPLAGRNRDVDDKSVYDQVPNSSLHSIALSDMNGEISLKVLDRLGVGSSILVLDSDRQKNINIINCESWRLDDFVNARNLPQPDFIKLDTQASELRILQASVSTLKRTKFILVETWARRIYGPETPLFHELSAWLHTQEFVLYDILSLDDGREPNGEVRWFDALFIKKEFSMSPAWSL
jgi:FkbM family methyltransferase